MKRCCVFLLIAASAFGADVTIVNEILAKVNDQIITKRDLERFRIQQREYLTAQGLTGQRLEAAIAEAEQNLLRDKIDTILLVSKASELNINVDSDLTRRLAQIQLQFQIPDQEKFQALVREQTGMSYEDYRAEQKDAMLRDRIIQQEVIGRINISRGEIEQYYNEHQKEFVREEEIVLRELLVATEGKDAAGVAAADKLAKDLVARARKGERFEDLVRDYSDANTKMEGGVLPPQKRGGLRAELEALVWDKERNWVTDPIKTANGWLILKVEAQHRAGQMTLEESEGMIRNMLLQPRFEPRYREYLTQLRQDAYLQIKPGLEDTAAAPGKNTDWVDPLELKPETVTKEEVAAEIHRKRLFWLVPIPGTNIDPVSSSQ